MDAIRFGRPLNASGDANAFGVLKWQFKVVHVLFQKRLLVDFGFISALIFVVYGDLMWLDLNSGRVEGGCESATLVTNVVVFDDVISGSGGKR